MKEFSRADWEEVKEQSEKIIKNSNLTLINAEMMLDRAEKELKKLPSIPKKNAAIL